LLKVCYVPATSASLPRVSFFFSFLFLLLRPLTVLMKQTRQAVRAVKQSIFLDVYGCHTADFKPVKQEVNGTEILSPVVFPVPAYSSPCYYNYKHTLYSNFFQRK
jgi:hypothetical protein